MAVEENNVILMALGELKGEIKGMSGKLDGVVDSQRRTGDKLEALGKQAQVHEQKLSTICGEREKIYQLFEKNDITHGESFKRIRRLEIKVYSFAGAVAIAGSILAYLNKLA